jgi:hypothetical protein
MQWTWSSSARAVLFPAHAVVPQPVPSLSTGTQPENTVYTCILRCFLTGVLSHQGSSPLSRHRGLRYVATKDQAGTESKDALVLHWWPEEQHS